MFFNLNAEMGRAKLTIKKLSEIIPRMYSLMIQKHTRHFRMIVARGM